MSGIAGLLRLDDAFISPGAIEAMAATMARRGPDGRRVWRDGPVALGHALLATTPEATAERQPWRHPETACVVVSDSRLDNRPELVRTLNLRAAEADEVGDGELLHAAYQRWGEGCAERLLGDFAFAIFDPRESRVLCARDVMGVRPFYYHHAPHRLFAFASEADALLSHAEVPADLNHGRIADALVGELEGIDRTSTFYAAVTRLPPAHTLIVDRKGLRLREYWHPLMHVPRGLPGADDEWIDAVREQVVQAVRRRLRASTPVGSMLSGGLDSSAVVASAHVVARERNAPAIHTFSGIDSAGACPETRAVHSMVRHVRATPTTLDLQDLDATAAELRPHLENRAEPFDGSMTLVDGMYWAASRAGVRALMDGMPADNLYPSGDLVHQLARRGQWLGAYSAAVDTHRLQTRWWPGLRALATVAGTWAPGSYHRLRSRWAERSFYQRELLAGSLIAPDFARQVGLWDRYMAYRDDMRRTMMGDSSGRSLTCMTAAYITAAVERYGRTAAFHAVEPRHPFLDRELVELHAWLPLGLRQRAGSEQMGAPAGDGEADAGGCRVASKDCASRLSLQHGHRGPRL